MQGFVSEWHPDEGWGVIDANDGAQVWTHFSHIQTDPATYRVLAVGETVELAYETPGQDGYAARALWVQPAGANDKQVP